MNDDIEVSAFGTVGQVPPMIRSVVGAEAVSSGVRSSGGWVATVTLHLATLGPDETEPRIEQFLVPAADAASLGAMIAEVAALAETDVAAYVARSEGEVMRRDDHHGG